MSKEIFDFLKECLRFDNSMRRLYDPAAAAKIFNLVLQHFIPLEIQIELMRYLLSLREVEV